MIDPNISDEQWFEMNLNPEDSVRLLGFSLPSLPPENIQRGFTGATGRTNLQQAFSFYKHMRDNYLYGTNPNVMDFGSGWGRIARFFLRDTKPQNIFAVDPHSVAVEWIAKTNLPCRVIHSNPLPPIRNLNQTKFNLIYAYSVFSHLSENYFHSWIHYLLSLLKDDGFIVFTTRGTFFIDYIERNNIRKNVFQDYATLRARYDKGKFLFFRDRDSSNELSGDYFGDAFIPKQYLEQKLSDNYLSFTESIPHVDQAVVVFKRGCGKHERVTRGLSEFERDKLDSNHFQKPYLQREYEAKEEQELVTRLISLTQERDNLQSELNTIYGSRTWRMAKKGQRLYNLVREGGRKLFRI